MAMNPRPISAGVALSLIGLTVGACGLVPGVCAPQNTFPGCDQVVITVGFEESAVTEGIDYSLEMVGSGWPIDAAQGGGVISADAPNGTDVVLFRTSDCRALLHFAADPGSAWVISIGGDGVNHQLRDPGEAIAMGPGIEEIASSGCGGE
jgi:hypothetical protein